MKLALDGDILKGESDNYEQLLRYTAAPNPLWPSP